MYKQFPFLILIFFWLTLPAALHAQNMRIEAPPGYNIIYMENDLPGGVEGSPYMDDWQLSDVYLKNGDIISGIMMRYHVFMEQMLFKINDNTYVIGEPERIAEIIMPGKTFVYKYYLKGRNIQKGFFEVKVKGKIGLLVKYETGRIYANYNVVLGTGNKNDQLQIKTKLYLQNGEQMLRLDKKSQLLEAMSDQSKLVMDFMKKEGLSHKNKDDMIRLLNYYNQLE